MDASASAAQVAASCVVGPYSRTSGLDDPTGNVTREPVDSGDRSPVTTWWSDTTVRLAFALSGSRATSTTSETRPGGTAIRMLVTSAAPLPSTKTLMFGAVAAVVGTSGESGRGSRPLPHRGHAGPPQSTPTSAPFRSPSPQLPAAATRSSNLVDRRPGSDEAVDTTRRKLSPGCTASVVRATGWSAPTSTTARLARHCASGLPHTPPSRTTCSVASSFRKAANCTVTEPASSATNR
mmetsp:Transcript_15008/g.46965  ORF Transcript_15008/g.46965 Transcript_15008/m.46965 type:complete len:237 (-) Transcript_15008:1590-2300(-)